MSLERKWSKEDLRDAVTALYQGKVRPSDVPAKYNGVSRQRAQELASQLPSGLKYTEDDLSLLRAATKVSGAEGRRRLYSDEEMRSALRAVQSKEMTQRQASETFRPKIGTLQKYGRELRQALQGRGMTVEAALCSLTFDKPGPRPLLTTDESDLLVAKADLAAEHGKGFSRRRLSSEGRRLCSALAEQEQDPGKRKRLLNAKCGPNWRQRALRVSSTSNAGKLGFRKPSDLSERRAAAKNEETTGEMFSKIRAMYDDHQARGILLGSEPDSDQVWNGDEVGFDPKGRWQQVLTSSRNRVFRTTTGEKAPFWVSAWIWTRADGQCFIPPALVHQGSQLSEFHALNLPSDWVVHATPSGYQDRDGFAKVCAQFIEYCGPKRPQYIFIDGHDSHFDSEALDQLASNNIFVFFLKSNNSEEDQPNDNGPNSALKACYDSKYDDWLHQFDGVPYNGAFFNSVFVPAWRDWKAKASASIAQAFSMCGLWPLNEKAANYTHGSELASKFKRQVDAPPAPSGQPDAAAQGSSTSPKHLSGQFLRPRRGDECTLLRAKAAAPERSILIRAAAHQYFQSSTIVPAQELQEVLQEQRKAKKNKVDASRDPDKQLANPSTRAGLYASEGVRKRCREVETAREEAKEAKRVAVAKAAEKRVEKVNREKSVAEELIGKVARNEINVTRESVERMKVAELRDGLRGMGQEVSRNEKKAALVELMLPRLLLAKSVAGHDDSGKLMLESNKENTDC